LPASAVSSVRGIGLQYDAVSAASEIASAIRPEFGVASWKPLVESINHAIAKPSWYYIAPGVSSLESLFRAIPSHTQGSALRTMPALVDGTPGRMLMTSRLQGKIFSIVAEKFIDPVIDTSYSAVQESRFLISFCGEVSKESLSFLGDERILMKSGSKAFVHRDKSGKILAMVVVPSDGTLKTSSEVLSAIGTSNYDSRSIRSNCEMKMESR